MPIGLPAAQAFFKRLGIAPGQRDFVEPLGFECNFKITAEQGGYFGNMVDVIIETQFMSEAVKIAYKLAESGDNVLLSPACASFDLFENYEDRGRQFKEAVRNL